MGRSNRAEWRERIAAWKASGLTAADYAARAGINAGTLKWWTWQLGAASKRASKTGLVRHTKHVPVATKAPPVPPLTFVEMTSRLAREPLEVVLRTEVRVRVHDDFDAHALGRLLDVLERRG